MEQFLLPLGLVLSDYSLGLSTAFTTSVGFIFTHILQASKCPGCSSVNQTRHQIAIKYLSKFLAFWHNIPRGFGIFY
ncbi:hypothetical protein [Nostoc sp.]|uniref:hypothetical protein n=1 Tax=Nostoc sp. TaxID=1180 RepID=UPI002FFC09CB